MENLALGVPLLSFVCSQLPPLSARICQPSRCSPLGEQSRAAKIRSRAAMCRLFPPKISLPLFRLSGRLRRSARNRFQISPARTWLDAIQGARAKGIPVVVGTRVPTGRVFPLSATKGSALSLKAIGCVLADNLSPQKARILLMLALTRTRDSEALQRYFDQ